MSTFTFRNILLTTPTLEKYEERVKNFEWWYFLTDDGYDHYDKMRTEEAYIEAIAEQSAPEYKEIFTKYKEAWKEKRARGLREAAEREAARAKKELESQRQRGDQ